VQQVKNPFRKSSFRIALLMISFLTLTPAFPLDAQAVSGPAISHLEVKKATTPKCTKKLLWYTKGSQICAPTTRAGSYKWQTSMKKSDVTKFMKTCRSFFATSAGQMLCDWTQKYVNNIITMKGPRDNCLTYLKALLDNAAMVAQTTKSTTVGAALIPFSQKYSWICHP
jgi:hypothetical protein